MLTSNLGISFESVFDFRIRFILEFREHLEVNRSGFKKAYSTVYLLVRLGKTFSETLIHTQLEVINMWETDTAPIKQTSDLIK